MFPHEPSAEEIAAFEEEQEMAEAYSEMMTKRIRRLFIEELTTDQLEALNVVFNHIGASAAPYATVQWYAGIVYSAIAARELLLGEGKEPEEL